VHGQAKAQYITPHLQTFTSDILNMEVMAFCLGGGFAQCLRCKYHYLIPGVCRLARLSRTGIEGDAAKKGVTNII
jgi:hypothetical protein